MRILFVGDSLGLPRPHRIKEYSPSEKELAVTYDETYSSLINFELNQRYNFEPFIEVVNRSHRFYTIKNVYNDFSDHLFYFEPDIIVIQVGIVDCWFRNQLNGKQLVDKVSYEKYLRDILKLVEFRPSCRIILVGIAPTSLIMESKYIGINGEIIAYNNILKSYVDNKSIYYIDLEHYIFPNNCNDYLLPDGHHLSKNGNKLLSKLLIDIIAGMIESDRGVNYYNTGEFDKALCHFQKSHSEYPFNIDNLFNIIILLHQLGKEESLKRIVSFVKEHDLHTNNEIKLILETFSVN